MKDDMDLITILQNHKTYMSIKLSPAGNFSEFYAHIGLADVKVHI